LWTEEPFSRGQAWVDLILLANHRDGFFRVRGQRVEVKRGQVGWSETSLSARWHWSRGKVRRFLAELESKSVQQIEQQKNNLTSLITILNYDQYQGDGTVDGTTDGTADGPQTDRRRYTNKNVKNVKNEKKESGSDFADHSPSPQDTVKQKKQRRQLPTDFTLTDELIAYARSHGLNGNIESVFEHFCDHHRARGNTMLDWPAAWRTWVRNEIKFGKHQRNDYETERERWMRKRGMLPS
jgi:hypothetical protein